MSRPDCPVLATPDSAPEAGGLDLEPSQLTGGYRFRALLIDALVVVNARLATGELAPADELALIESVADDVDAFRRAARPPSSTLRPPGVRLATAPWCPAEPGTDEFLDGETAAPRSAS